jgi:mRNA-degrading endonuclease RelE of RelBE toxin-antitoxin system
LVTENPHLKYTPQVRDYITLLPPEVKKQFRAGLMKLSQGKGDTRALRPPLEGYWRLRIGHRRIIYTHIPPSTLYCLHAEDRATVYQTFIPPQ